MNEFLQDFNQPFSPPPDWAKRQFMKISLLPPVEKEKVGNNPLNHPHPAPIQGEGRGEGRVRGNIIYGQVLNKKNVPQWVRNGGLALPKLHHCPSGQ